MQSIRHKTLFAALFVFATGFTSIASASFDVRCEACMNTYHYCMSQPGASEPACVDQYNLCAAANGCLPMPI